jgi:hypothetical protein
MTALAVLLAVVAFGGAAFAPPKALAAAERLSMTATMSSAVGPGAEIAVRQDAPTGASTAGICQSDAPIKAASTEDGDRLFYVPGDLLYEGTVAERCFADEGSARASGYQMHAH